MTRQRQDRFEQAVDRVAVREARDGMGPVVLTSTALHLLRLEHRAVVRLVKRLCKQNGCYKEGVEFERGYRYACIDMLVALAKRKGGGEHE